MILEKIFKFIDKNYHHPRINKFLLNYKIETVIDVGSHKGEFLENLVKFVNFKKAYTFEPQKKIFKILVEKFKDKEKFIHNNLAVSDIVGSKSIKISKLTSTSTLSNENKNSNYLKFKKLIVNDKNENNQSYNVDTITLDSFFKEKKLNNCLLKIDVEGHELNVLNGSKNAIKKIKYIILERQYFNSYADSFPKECDKFLINNSFKLIKKFRFPTLQAEDRFYINKEY